MLGRACPSPATRPCLASTGTRPRLHPRAPAHAGLAPPLILKPSVACGLPQSHHMAMVTAPGGHAVAAALQAARIPLPAIAQQFSSHGGRVAKVYVAGSKVGRARGV